MTDPTDARDHAHPETSDHTDPHDPILLAVARFAQRERVTAIVVVPRGPGVVTRARDLARCTGLHSATEITADHISLWFAPA